MRLEINTIRRLLMLSLSKAVANREIARLLNTTHQTVRRYSEEISKHGLTVERLNELDNVQLSSILGLGAKRNSSKVHNIDWSHVDYEHQVRDVQLIVLWTEYSEIELKKGFNFISESTFRRQYSAWRKSQKISMRQFHPAGEKCFVDFAGKTIPIFDPNSGEVTYAQIFVACLGASSLIFAYAVESQKSADWLRCHVEMFKFFDGVPKFVVPDNLRSAITKNTSKDLVINRAYQELAEHYDTIIFPARVRKPKDKSLAEISVRIVQDWALKRLRNIKFFSVAELNEQLKMQIAFLNNRVTRTFPISRLERFFNDEKEQLKSLPNHEFSIASWKYGVSVPDDYHVKYSNTFYSVPYLYRHCKVDLRISLEHIQIFNGAKQIAIHLLKDSGNSTNLEHLPPSHKYTHENSQEELRAWSISIGSATLGWCEHNLQLNTNFAYGIKAVTNLRKLMLQKNYTAERIQSACAFATRINKFTYSYIRDVLKLNLDQRKVPETTFLVKDHENIRGKKSFIIEGDK